MPNSTTIGWTDFSSNPLRYRNADGQVVWGCVKVSSGCQNCYSAALAHRYHKGGPFTRATQAGLTPFLDEKELRTLLTSEKIAGKKVFLADMTDVFGDWVPDEMIAALFGVMAARHDVTWQVLTKRADRMRGWFEWADGQGTAGGCSVARALVEGIDSAPLSLSEAQLRQLYAVPWPLPNVHVGVSVENQARADERVWQLIQTPAAVRFLSVEPQLGPVDLDLPRCERHDREHIALADDNATPWCVECDSEASFGHWLTGGGDGIDWVIVGGESGPGARPMALEWATSLLEQCQRAGVPVWMKQLGACVVSEERRDLNGDWAWRMGLRDRKGADWSEWPEDLRVREFPGGNESSPC